METIAALCASPLFEMLSDQELQAVSSLGVRRSVRADEVILQEGELGASLYVLLSGEVVIRRRDSAGREQEIASLRPPQCFGEMGLVDRDFRSASVHASIDTELVEISAVALTEFRQRYRDGYTYLVLNIARVLSTRLREATEKLLQRGLAP